MTDRIPVAILGATGSVGQRFVQLLASHPWFEIAALTGSERALGKPYGEACRWVLAEPMPAQAAEMVIEPSDDLAANGRARIAFSALPSDLAYELEPRLAHAGLAVCSNASAFRRDEDVPLLLPEVNPGHAALVHAQRARHGWAGCIVTNPNCTSAGLTVALKALQPYGLQRVLAVSLQALSGAGYPGVASLDILDNAIPYIGGEEDKVEWEPRKMLGDLAEGGVRLSELVISAHTNRVAVSDGHLVCASLELEQPLSPQDAAQALGEYRLPLESLDLPSAPRPPIVVRAEPDRPQPRLDRMTGAGMTTVVGRLRPDPLFTLKFVVLSHNTIRGAAGGSIYNAELLVSQGLV
jgi:aspartate-semialdehyde dehydrogenase